MAAGLPNWHALHIYTQNLRRVPALCFLFHKKGVPNPVLIKLCAAGMLVRNYRSHSALLHIPNALFYKDALIAAADQKSVQPPSWRELASDPDVANGRLLELLLLLDIFINLTHKG